jgi:hypothetical protein
LGTGIHQGAGGDRRRAQHQCAGQRGRSTSAPIEPIVEAKDAAIEKPAAMPMPVLIATAATTTIAAILSTFMPVSPPAHPWPRVDAPGCHHLQGLHHHRAARRIAMPAQHPPVALGNGERGQHIAGDPIMGIRGQLDDVAHQRGGGRDAFQPQRIERGRNAGMASFCTAASADLMVR